MFDNATNRALTPDEIKAILSSKKAKRANKGLDFPVYYFSMVTKAYLESIDDETRRGPSTPRGGDFAIWDIEKIVNAAYDQAEQQGYPIRFQLMVRTSYAHHVPIDIEITDKGVNLLCIESGSDPSATKCFDVICGMFRDKNPSGEHHLYMVAPEGDEVQSIQFDAISCSIFAMDNLAKLTHINPFQYLANSQTKVESNKVIKIKAHEVPTEMGFIFRGIQSLTAYTHLPSDTKTSAVSRRGESLGEAIEANTSKQKRVKKGITVFKDANTSIERKRRGYIEDATKHLEQTPGPSDTERQDAINDRVDALTVISNGTFLSTESYPSANYPRIIEEYISLVSENLSKSAKTNSRFSQLAYLKGSSLLEQAKFCLAHGHYSDALNSLLSIEKVDNIRLKNQMNSTLKLLGGTTTKTTPLLSLNHLKPNERKKAMGLYVKGRNSSDAKIACKKVIQQYLSHKPSRILLSRHHKKRAEALLNNLEGKSADETYKILIEEITTLNAEGAHHRGLYASVLQLSLLGLRQEINEEAATKIESSFINDQKVVEAKTLEL